MKKHYRIPRKKKKQMIKARGIKYYQDLVSIMNAFMEPLLINLNDDYGIGAHVMSALKDIREGKGANQVVLNPGDPFQNFETHHVEMNRFEYIDSSPPCVNFVSNQIMYVHRDWLQKMKHNIPIIINGDV